MRLWGARAGGPVCFGRKGKLGVRVAGWSVEGVGVPYEIHLVDFMEDLEIVDLG